MYNKLIWRELERTEVTHTYLLRTGNGDQWPLVEMQNIQKSGMHTSDVLVLVKDNYASPHSPIPTQCPVISILPES